MNLMKLKDLEQLYQIMFHIWIFYTICPLHFQALLPRFVNFLNQKHWIYIFIFSDTTDMFLLPFNFIAEEISEQTPSCWPYQVGLSSNSFLTLNS